MDGQPQSSKPEANSNPNCSDCGKENPKWIILKPCIWICPYCSGVHRSLGNDNPVKSNESQETPQAEEPKVENPPPPVRGDALGLRAQDSDGDDCSEDSAGDNVSTESDDNLECNENPYRSGNINNVPPIEIFPPFRFGLDDDDEEDEEEENGLDHDDDEEDDGDDDDENYDQ